VSIPQRIRLGKIAPSAGGVEDEIADNLLKFDAREIV
jgi:hypothetical protein